MFVRRRLAVPLGNLVRAFATIDPNDARKARLPERESAWRDELDDLTDAGNRYLSVVDAHLDERRKAEKNLLESEARIRSIIENTAEGIISIDAGGSIETFNPASERIFGYAAEEVVGQNVSVLLPELQRAEHQGFLDKSELYGPRIINQARDLEGRRKDGELFSMELNVAPMVSAGSKGFIGILRDITARKQAEDELRLSKEDADNANRAKSEFLSSMSHELRTPMNAILGFGQMLEYNPQEPLTTTQQRCVDQIIKGGKHLLELINDVLDLAQIEAGKVALSPENIRVGDILGDCLPMVAGMAEKRGIDISLGDIPEQAAVVIADYTRLRQVLLNLLSNAVKYNRDGGSVVIETEGGGDRPVRIRITDTGRGIAPESRADLFLPFTRLGAENSEIEGTGIGLTVTKRLLEFMGGAIGLESEVGRGSTFWIDLPAGIRGENDGAEAPPAAAARLLSDAKGMLLYVEDNPANLELMELIVERVEGLAMISAHNADFGLEQARDHHPDLIVMDINLPGMNGIQALQQLQRSDETADIPVIALSAAATASDIEKGLEAGFRYYLTKPMRVDEVVNTIKAVLEDNGRAGASGAINT